MRKRTIGLRQIKKLVCPGEESRGNWTGDFHRDCVDTVSCVAVDINKGESIGFETARCYKGRALDSKLLGVSNVQCHGEWRTEMTGDAGLSSPGYLLHLSICIHSVCRCDQFLRTWLGFLGLFVHQQEEEEEEEFQNSNDSSIVSNRIRTLSSRIDHIERAVAEQQEQEIQLRLSLGDRSGRGNNRSSSSSSPIAVLVLACNRPEAIKNHLEQLIRLRPSPTQFPIMVSVDCQHQPTIDMIKGFGSSVSQIMEQPDQTPIVLTGKQKKFIGYYKIARHYAWALNQTFYKHGHSHVIVTEDDLNLAPDFFEYFSATRSVLDNDRSLWCVSAWNDNGKAELIEQRPELLHRTDFFPGTCRTRCSSLIGSGLGWMLSARTWNEVSNHWPLSYWDDWMRLPEQRKDRACLRPEISRTAMSQMGKKGVSKGLYYEKHLKKIVLNDKFFAFSRANLTSMKKSIYDDFFITNVYKWPSITQTELRKRVLDNGKPLPECVRLTYEEKNTFRTTARAFGLMDDFRAGVPRTAYRGIVSFMYQTTRVYLAPPETWTKYDPSWK